MAFPLPLALLGLDGEVRVANENFLRLFDLAQLSPVRLRPVLDHPGEKGRLLALVGREGRDIEVRARSSYAHNGLLLVVDEVPAIAVNLEIEQLNHRILELEKLSATDRLTGAWNRRHLDRVVESELARSLRLKQPLSLVLLDIDHFKRVNDEYGHQAGDAVLCELVGIIGESIRTGDTLFRWGGEEFVVLAAATSYRQAHTMAEGLRSRVEQHPFGIVGKVTVSLGVAEHNGSESAPAWFARVDAALYSAKHAGRNCVSVDRRGSSDAWVAADRGSVLHLAWSDAYECGEPTIDGEHRELFVLANALIDASFEKDAAPEPFHAALDRLLGHIERHFADEEALLERHGYAQLDMHKRAHAGLLARACELRADALAGSVAPGALIEFLANDVVARHLLSADREFFPLFATP